MYERGVKRALDFLLSLAAIAALSPLLMAVALLVRLRLGRPVLFRQERPGRGGRPFVMLKFRTMTDRRDARGRLLPDERRLTPFGRALRASSLDELPELFNVLRGDMSLVGPRPLLMKYLPLYSERQGRRHEARPGITGLAQVSGRNGIGWEERLEWDVRYVEHVSLRLDLIILLRTVGTVLRREGIHSATSQTMEEFTGGGKENAMKDGERKMEA